MNLSGGFIKLILFTVIGGYSSLHSLSSQRLLEKYPPGVKRITEWYEWINTYTDSVVSKEISAVAEYFPNGKVKTELFYNGNGDTSTLYAYFYNKKDQIKYVSYLTDDTNRWIKSDRYFYKNGKISSSLDEEGTRGKYFSDIHKHTICSKYRFKDPGNGFTLLISSQYDSLGRIIRKAEKGGYNDYVTNYVYITDSSGKVQRRAYTDRDPQYLIYHLSHGFLCVECYPKIPESELGEIVEYNEKGEIIQVLCSFVGSKPGTRKLYKYEYY